MHIRTKIRTNTEPSQEGVTTHTVEIETIGPKGAGVDAAVAALATMIHPAERNQETQWLNHQLRELAKNQCRALPGGIIATRNGEGYRIRATMGTTTAEDQGQRATWPDEQRTEMARAIARAVPGSEVIEEARSTQDAEGIQSTGEDRTAVKVGPEDSREC